MLRDSKSLVAEVMAGVNGQGWALTLKVKYDVGAPCCGWRLPKDGKGNMRDMTAEGPGQGMVV